MLFFGTPLQITEKHPLLCSHLVGDRVSSSSATGRAKFMDEADVSENLRREQMQQQTISGLGKLGQPPLILLPAMFCGAHNVPLSCTKSCHMFPLWA
eukprot:1154860-Pelagomonas_calceolata.AAC.5